jgi:nitrite reductase/ring-hydroxylating ferredoxin subunit
MAEEHTVATVAQVAPGCMKRVEIGERAVVLFNVEGEIYASDDVCPHRGAPLSVGDFYSDGIVMCPLHAWEFDVRTGYCVSLPEATCALRRHGVRIEDGLVKVALEP